MTPFAATVAIAAAPLADVAHSDPVASLALWLTVILLSAKLGGDLAVRLGQPAVLGELHRRRVDDEPTGQWLATASPT